MPSRSVNDRPSRSTDHVELFRVHRFHHGVQPGSLLPALGAADPSILENFHDLPAGAISYRFQFPPLIFGVLFGRADANVECKKAAERGCDWTLEEAYGELNEVAEGVR
jgi:hypothetical protein